MEARTILVVEDDPFIRMDLTHHLMECGYHVLEATTVGEAMGLLGRVADIDLVLTDLALPGKADGLDLVRWVSERHPHIPVIVATGDTARHEAIKTACGANAFLKPYDSHAISGRIRELLGGASSRRP